MDRPKLEVADVFRRYGEAYREKHGASMSTAQRRVMTAIEVCRTAALGGHLERCDQCGHERNCFTAVADVARDALSAGPFDPDSPPVADGHPLKVRERKDGAVGELVIPVSPQRAEWRKLRHRSRSEE